MNLSNHVTPVGMEVTTIHLSALIRVVSPKVYNWQSYVDIARHSYAIKIFNFSIQFIWLNPAYILPDFCRTTL